MFGISFISSSLNSTNVFWRSAGNIYTNISGPIFYQAILEGENKKYQKLNIASSSSYSG